MSTDLLVRLSVALAIGLIVGLERGWRLRAEPEGSRVAGLRTYGLTGLLGGTAAALAEAFDYPAFFAAAFVVFALVFAWSEQRAADRRGSYSVTAAVAGIAVFALGGLAVAGDRNVAAAGGVAVACLLASRDVIHGLLRRLTWPEVRSALLLLAMTAIVLPILPNRAIDPWGGINPFHIWLFTVLTAAISFAGYIAMRIVGPSRGTLAASLLGALVSSTAVTMTLGRRAKVEGPDPKLVGGASLAAMVSVLRVSVLVALVAPAILPLVLGPVLAGAAVFAAAGFWFMRRPGAKPARAETSGNPFDIWPLALFAGTFAVVSLVSALATTYLGPGSLVATSGVSAIADVDVATLTAARLAAEGFPGVTAAQAIVVALASNGVGRVLVAMAVGPVRYWRTLGVIAATAILAGAVAAVLIGPF